MVTKKTGNPRGRPPKGEKKMRQVTLKMDPDELAALHKLVANHQPGTKKGGMTWSQYLRALILAGTVLAKNPATLREAALNGRDALTGQMAIDVSVKGDENADASHSATH